MKKILNMLHGKTLLKNSSGINSAAFERLQKASKLNKTEIFEFLDSSPLGLDNETIEKKQEEFGLNHIQREKIPRWYEQLFDAFINPFIGILVLIAIVTFIIDIWLVCRRIALTNFDSSFD